LVKSFIFFVPVKWAFSQLRPSFEKTMGRSKAAFAIGTHRYPSGCLGGAPGANVIKLFTVLSYEFL